MTKTYMTPEMRVELFAYENIITTSGYIAALTEWKGEDENRALVKIEYTQLLTR